MEKKETNHEGFTGTFISKLKEQSFTIILLVGILYYQNTTYNNQIDEYKKMIDEKEAIILDLTNEERERLIERCNYLMDQRDEYVDELINKK
jgi:hypothetical protein